eukprot:Nitzschia sp. Nitz4//scaffold21_size171442//55465//57003//NITZ4_002156-RA/size171442-processed-gene-0.11-mRNA-1//1//CDS//3329542396//2850//frame0
MNVPAALESLQHQGLEGLSKHDHVVVEEAPLETLPKEVKVVDSLLAKEFSTLSIGQREHSYEELHGVDDVVQETPAFLAQKLTAFRLEVEQIEDKPAYDLAVTLPGGKEYVSDIAFCLKFLRSEYFDVPKAAQRMVGYLDCLVHYFGERCLTRDIRYQDLGKDDIAFLKAGQMQVLPCRDRGGRAVYMGLNHIRDRAFKESVNFIRCYMYVWQALSDDVENQRRGVVIIYIHLGLHFASDDVQRDLVKEAPRVTKYVPARIAAIHFCVDSHLMYIVCQLAVVGMTAETRARHRFHFGTFTENMYRLMTFGIPVEHVPINAELVIKRTNASRWIARRKFKEQQMTTNILPFLGVELPTKNDVLTGKGRPIQRHSGNVRFRALVDVLAVEYTSSTKSNKAAVVANVFDAIKASNGRFLCKDEKNGFWFEISDAEAMQKVTKTFLTAGTKMKHQTEGSGAITPLKSILGDKSPASDRGGNDLVFLPMDKKPRVSGAFCCGQSSQVTSYQQTLTSL